jgi:tRNA A-37 threonylcarbamoyl transferase component Bud32
MVGADRIVAGRYELREVIAADDFREVFTANDTNKADSTVITLFKLVDDPDVRDRVEKEARTLSSLWHPNITKVRDLGIDGDDFYVVMESPRGTNLVKTLQTDKEMPVHRAQHLLTQILSALKHASEAGLAHGTVRPENVVVDGRDGVHVTLALQAKRAPEDEDADGQPRTNAISGSLQSALDTLESLAQLSSRSDVASQTPEQDDQTVWPIPGSRYDPEKLGRRVILAIILVAVIAFTAFIWRVTSRRDELNELTPSISPSISLQSSVESNTAVKLEIIDGRGTLLAKSTQSSHR